MILARDIINQDIPTLKSTDSADLALKWMDEFKVFQLPIVNNVELIGVISESDILSLNDDDEIISTYRLSLLRPHIQEDEHIYEVIKNITQLKLSVLPVVNKQMHYLGSITLRTLSQKISEMASMNEPGGLIVLRVNVPDYSLGQMAQIVESNDAKVLSSYITSLPNSQQMEVTLKINKEDLSGIVQTFNRYNYEILATYHHSEYEEDVKRRLEEFTHYLRM